jgi:perosamine synthetase
MIPINEPLLGQRDLEYVSECVGTGWISSAGRFIEAFEQGWAEYCGRKHGIAVCNGTAALQAAVAALSLEPGDEVIMPTFTIISCALAVVYAGGVPVLVDSDPETWTMNVDRIADRITPRTKAIMAVHIYGHPVDMDPILDLAEQHGLAVIEDAAEAHGANYLSGRYTAEKTWQRCGSFGTMSCFSFYANKVITTGEGGMVLTDTPSLADKVRSLRNLCFETGQRFLHNELGYNFRITNLQAALGVAQVERIDELVARKRWMGEAYTKRLQGLSTLQLPAEKSWAQNVYWMYGVVISEETGMNAATFAQRLAKQGVQTRPFFLGIHEQPVFRRDGLFRSEVYPVAERLARQGLYLPSGMALTEVQLEQVAKAVQGLLAS